MDASFVDLVDPLTGTRSLPEFSRGSTLPLIQRPWAMTAWSPVTSDDPWFFHPDLPRLRGLRATRQPSPWLGDYGGFTFCPQNGPLVLDPTQRASAYRLDRSRVSPHRLTVEFLRYRIAADLAPTDRCAFVKLTFAEGGGGRILFEVPSGQVAWNEAAGELQGTSTAAAGGVYPGFAGFFSAAFDRPVARFGAEGTVAWVEFAVPRGGTVEVRIGTSFLGFDQARSHRERELGALTLEQVADEGASVWNRLLGRFAVEGGTEAQRKTFYGGLYRALCFPRKIHEPDAQGNPVHRHPITGATTPGFLCADHDLRETSRSVYPLYALAWRDALPEILEGWTQMARDTGWMPALASPGPRGGHIGSPADGVFAEAFAKGIEGFDREAAWKALRRHGSEQPSSGEGGRTDWSQSVPLGYFPAGTGTASVSATLAASYGDWCLGQMARAQGLPSEGLAYEDRSKQWQNLFDPSMGFFRPRNADGEWTDGFNPLAWGGAFAGTSAWQGGWEVPHDPEGLIAALGGVEVATARLDTLLALKPWYQVGPGEGESHRMTEMALAGFGQYAHGVPAAHSILWYYALVGKPEKTERLTRRVIEELYGPGVDGFCGEDHQGTLGAWYVWASLGLYPLCPGSPDYVLGSPLFPRVTVQSGDGRSLVIEASGEDTPVVRRRTLGNVVLRDPRVSQADLFDLGRLVVERGEP